jgi:hypothetical protein
MKTLGGNTLSLTSALNGVDGQRHAPAALSTEIDPVSIAQEEEWAAGPVWMCPEIIAPTGNRSSDPLALPTALHRPTQTDRYYTNRQIASNITTRVCVTAVVVGKH